MILKQKYIGERWLETVERIDAMLVIRSELQDKEKDFLDSLRDRLLDYRDRAFVSAKQLNWLSQIEEHYHERRR